MPVYAAVLDFEAIYANRGAEKHYAPLPKYPAVTRDLAFVCDEDTESQTISDVIRGACGKLLEDVTLFDVYRGAQLVAHKKSLAFKLTLRAADHTLTDDEADAEVKLALDAVGGKLGLAIRL